MAKFTKFVFLFILAIVGFNIHPFLGGVISIGLLVNLSSLLSKKKNDTVNVALNVIVIHVSAVIPCGYASCRCCYRCRDYPCSCD